MKEVILSADGDSVVYLVPDPVAEDLDEYCMEFCTRWMQTSPHAARYRTTHGFCYNEGDFVGYLNEFVFPQEKSVFVKNLGWIGHERELPEEYQNCPRFNF